MWWSWPKSKQWFAVGALSLTAVLLAFAFTPNGNELGMFAAFFAWFAVPLFVAWILTIGIVTGQFPSRYGPISRKSEPFDYWLWFAMLIATLSVSLGANAYFAWDILSGS